MSYANYLDLASSSLDKFLNDINFNFYWSRGYRTFNDSFFSRDKQPDVHNIVKIKDLVYSVNLDSRHNGKFILVFLTPTYEFEKLIFVFADRLGRGEIEIVEGALTDVEDWLRHQTFLPDVGYEPKEL